MFSTNNFYKLPWSFDENSAEWRCVELSLNLPWFLVEVRQCDDKLLRTFFFTSLEEVTPFIDAQPTVFKFLALNLALPPTMSGTLNWLFVPIQKIGLELPKEDGSASRLILTGKNGLQYGDKSFKPVVANVGELTTLIEFI